MGIGVNSEALNPDNWTRAYGFVTGVTSGGELEKLSALRTYQENVRIHQPGRDEMIMMNTWGDRGQDTRLNEAFCNGRTCSALCCVRFSAFKKATNTPTNAYPPNDCVASIKTMRTHTSILASIWSLTPILLQAQIFFTTTSINLKV